jgi:hypothetical protein
MWSDCQRWLGEVEQNTPTVVLAARDADGHDLNDVAVQLDDRPFVDRLDASPHPLDPGEHVFRFRRDGREVTERVILRTGEKARVITVQIEPRRIVSVPSSSAMQPSDSPPGSRTPVPAYAFGGVGLVALGGFAYFGLTGRDAYFDAKAACSPSCSASEVSTAKTKLLVADVFLGASLLSLGAATYFFFAKHEAR